jgi:uncharacterized protein (TIGR02597 family)
MRILLPLFLFLFLLNAGLTAAQDNDATRPIGFVKHLCPEGSDTWVATPFDHVKAETTVEIKGRPRVVDSRGTVIFYLSKRQPWDKNEFVDTHYLRIAGSHHMAGRLYKIQSTSRTSVVVEYEDYFPRDDFEKGHELEIVPYPTLDDLFPPDSQTSFQLSDGALPLQRKTELLLFEDQAVNSTPTPPTSFFITADGWQQVTNEGVQPAGGFQFTPWIAMVVRNKTGLGDTEFLATGQLPKYPQHRPLRSQWNERFEVPTPAPNLVPTRLADMQLTTRHGIFRDSESTDPAERGSELLIFDGAVIGLNKEPTATYFRVAGQWHLDDGASYPLADDVEVQPGTSFSIKKQRTWFHQWKFITTNLQEGEAE